MENVMYIFKSVGKFGQTSFKFLLYMSCQIWKNFLQTCFVYFKPSFSLLLELELGHSHVFMRPPISHLRFPPQQSRQCTRQEYSLKQFQHLGS